VGIVAALLLWWLPPTDYKMSRLFSLVICAIAAYALMEASNINSLIRVRTQSVPALWFIALASMGFVHDYQPHLLSAVFLAFSYYFLFRTYQKNQPVVDIFHAFVMLGLGSIFLPQLLWFAPFYFWYLIVYLRALSLRGFCAGFIGLLLPGWIAVNACFLFNRMPLVLNWLNGIFSFQPIVLDNYLSFSHDSGTLGWLLAWSLVGGLSLWSAIQYVSSSYADKIQTRMLLYILVSQSVIILLFAVLQPINAKVLLMPMLVSSMPLIAHYFTLTHTWFASLVFVLSAAVLTGIALLTLTASFAPQTTTIMNTITKLTQ